MYIQASTRHEGDADDEDIPAGRTFIYHRKFLDVIPIQTSIDKLVDARFKEDIHRQHRVLHIPEGIEDVDENTNLETLEALEEAEDISVIPRRSEQLRGKACLMLLSLLPSGVGGPTGGLALSIQPNDRAEELIEKMIKQAAKKAVDKAYDTFDIFGNCGELSPDSMFISIFIFR